MDTKEGQLRIRNWIDQASDNAALVVGKPIVLAAKRHDLVLNPQTGSPGHPVGLQSRARDQASSRPSPLAGADRDTCFGFLDPIDLDPILDLASVASFLEESPEAAGRVHPTGLGSIICYANSLLSILADTGRPRKPGPVALLAD